MISQEFVKRHLFARSALSDLLLPLSKLNELYQKQRRLFYRERAWQAPCKVISVGNITSGGSGKTPFCIWLAKLLFDSGIKVGVSHRGYKGALEKFPSVISDGNKLLYGVKDTGDEAYLLASNLKGIPVVVGKERRAAVSLILGTLPDTQIVILDDGFQHLKIKRDLDFICFNGQVGTGNGRVIPSGYLREPLSAISTDDIIILNNQTAKSDQSDLKKQVASLTQNIFECQYRISGLKDTLNRQHLLSDLNDKRIALVSGIANPDSFENTVKHSGISFLSHFSYTDHHSFSDPKEIAMIIEYCRIHKIDHLLCTEKDLAKLSGYDGLKELLFALIIEIVCPDGEKLKSLIWEKLGL